MAARPAGPPRALRRDAAGGRDLGAPDGPVRRAGLLELLPLGQPAQRRRPPEARDGGARLARDPFGARGRGAGRATPSRWTAASSPAWSPRRSPSRPEIELVREEARAIPQEGFVVIATGPLTSPRARRRDRRAARDRRPVLLRFHGADRRGLVARPLEDVRALALRQGRRRGLPELPAVARADTRRSSTRCSRARPCRSRTSRRASTSRAACRSRSWPSAGARRCATAR